MRFSNGLSRPYVQPIRVTRLEEEAGARRVDWEDIMKSTLWGAALAVAQVSCAVAQDGPPPGAMPPGGMPPPGAMAQINLGNAGLMASYYNADYFGTVQFRSGNGRAAIGAADEPGAPQSGYKDKATSLVVPLNLMHALPDGQSYLRFNLTGTLANGADELVEMDGPITRLEAQYLTFPDPNTMYAAGIFVEKTDLEIIGAGTLVREGIGLRFDMLKKFNDHWGMSARAEYSWGETDLSLDIGPGMVLQHVQGDDRLYLQTELVGTFTAEDSGMVPQGWVMHPAFGALFQRSYLETTANSFGAPSSGVVGDTEDYGLIWGHLRYEKKVAPGQWAPNFTLGLEHEVVNDLDALTQDSTFAVIGAGVSRQQMNGNRVDLSVLRHQGVSGESYSQTLLAAFIMNF